MTAQEIAEMVNEILEEYFEIERERILPEAHIFDDLELDSLDIVDLIVAMQKQFDVRIRDDERIKTIRTVADIYRFVATLEEEGASPVA
jgi:acyl carrier protein